jgi:pyridoxamine 5'-phosphate oxidase
MSVFIPPSPSAEEHRNTGTASADPFTIDDPMDLFADWFAAAQEGEPRDANAMTLSTVDPAGHPDSRTVLLKDADAKGFVFYSNAQSAKGQQISGLSFAALNFYWRSTACQVRVRGPVSLVTEPEADAYFASRARDSRIGAWASDQSRPLPSRAVIEARIAALEAEYEGRDVPRPPHWLGYRVGVLEIEFWAERPFRLHDRRLFRRAALDRPFTSLRLYP